MRMALPPLRFEQYTETGDIEEYFKRLELFLEVNCVKEEQQVACVLSDIGARTYAVLKNLRAPTTPKDSSLANIKAKLIGYYKPKSRIPAARAETQRKYQ